MFDLQSRQLEHWTTSPEKQSSFGTLGDKMKTPDVAGYCCFCCRSYSTYFCTDV